MFVVFFCFSSGLHFGQILHVLALENSSDKGTSLKIPSANELCNEVPAFINKTAPGQAST